VGEGIEGGEGEGRGRREWREGGNGEGERREKEVRCGYEAMKRWRPGSEVIVATRTGAYLVLHIAALDYLGLVMQHTCHDSLAYLAKVVNL